ncbi:YSC84-related protein [Salinivibrio sp. ES.052]|uniref:lipid-binding SYLF domain-containing protein n=1 Tax=Salinivibrio sp. ES.052 TaxID=1882823 RepID=UPI00092C9431|nr:lipid-binding SYLF domain-containing protein [Salinivibrio sp. ES.052]SIN97944.1 Las17-binding protein actin regulator [Salinivibrio sp. ES.052]
MTRFSYRWFALAIVALAALNGCASSSQQDQIRQADLAREQFYQYPQTQPFFDNAYGYAVFPSVGKGGFWVGGAYGKGVIYRQGNPVGAAELKQVSVGLTFGGQAFSEIVFFEDKTAYDRFMKGQVELGAQASATALTEGASAQTGTSGTSASASNRQSKAYYVNGLTVFTHAKGGLMLEAALAGQQFTPATW